MTPATTMSTAEHAQAARRYLENSNLEFAYGNVPEGSQYLWLAAAHAMTSAAQQHGWPHDSHRALKEASVRLAEVCNDELIWAGFAVAEEFMRHRTFDYMEPWQRTHDRPVVHDFVERVLAE